MDYRHGLPLFLSRGLLMDTGSRGLLSTEYELTGYRLHRYRLYRMLLFPDDPHELFNSVLMCFSVYYHRLTAISLLLPSTYCYGLSSNAVNVFTLGFRLFPFKKSVASLYSTFSFIVIIVNSFL